MPETHDHVKIACRDMVCFIVASQGLLFPSTRRSHNFIILSVASANGAALEAHRHQPFSSKDMAHLLHQAPQHLIEFRL